MGDEGDEFELPHTDALGRQPQLGDFRRRGVQLLPNLGQLPEHTSARQYAKLRTSDGPEKRSKTTPALEDIVHGVPCAQTGRHTSWRHRDFFSLSGIRMQPLSTSKNALGGVLGGLRYLGELG